MAPSLLLSALTTAAFRCRWLKELKLTLDFSPLPEGTKAPFLLPVGIEQAEAVAGMYKLERVQTIIIYRTELVEIQNENTN